MTRRPSDGLVLDRGELVRRAGLPDHAHVVHVIVEPLPDRDGGAVRAHERSVFVDLDLPGTRSWRG